MRRAVARRIVCGSNSFARFLSTDFVPETPVLVGSCTCKASGFVASGESVLNVITHEEKARAATGRQHVAVSCFNPGQVQWTGKCSGTAADDGVVRCGCDTREVLGFDESRATGMVMVDHACAARQSSVSESFVPLCHVWYGDRTAPVKDGLPKWKSLVGGSIVPEDDTEAVVPAAGGEVGPGGAIRRTTRPLSSPASAAVYTHTEIDPPVRNHGAVFPADVLERRRRSKYLLSPEAYVAPAKSKYGAIVVGGGHNGLVAAAYLAKQGVDVLVLERRHVLGGAAVSEELHPGFTFSRGSYVAGLFRPDIISDLNLEQHGFKYLARDPSSFTPTAMNGPYGGKSLIFWDDADKTWQSMAQFSERDADALAAYEGFLHKVREIMAPILDGPPPDPTQGRWKEKMHTMKRLGELVRVGSKNSDALVPFYELLTAPASQIVERWFENDVIRTTIATDAIIGGANPREAGSAYVLLHHVMGEAGGKAGVWSYVQGGMGAISRSVASAARGYGAEIATSASVKRIVTAGGRVAGVEMEDGSVLEAPVVLSNANPYHTFLELMPESLSDPSSSPLPDDFIRHMRFQNYGGGPLKINCAVDRAPDFTCLPSGGEAAAHHRGTIHFESCLADLEMPAREAFMGMPATRPVIEMTVPSAVDPTVAPPGKHVVQLYCLYCGFHDVDPKYGSWANEEFKNRMADRVFKIVDEFAPGFSSSVLYRDVLSTWDLERTIGLQKGNLSHGSLSLHQLGYCRPMSGWSSYRTPVGGLYLCGSGAHPGGGVTGMPGRNCAGVVLSDVS